VRTFVFNAPADGKVTLLFRAGRLGALAAPASIGASRAAFVGLPSQGGCLVCGVEIVPGAGS
jgi:hypothetical protein